MSKRRSTGLSILAAVARHVASGLAGFVTIPLVAYALGANGVAAWALIGTAAFALGLSDLGLSVAVQRAATQKGDAEVHEAVRAATSSVALIAPVLAFASYTWMLDFDNAPTALREDAAVAGVVALSGGVVMAYGFPFRSLAVVRGALGSLAAARALAALVQVVVTSLLLWWRASLLGPAIGLAVASVVETVSLIVVARRVDPRVPLVPRIPSWARAQSLFHEGAPSVVVNLAAVLAMRFDIVILSRVAPLAAVAAYGVAFRAVDQSFTLAKQASTALMPRLAKSAERAAAIKLGTIVVGGLVASGMAALATRGHPLLRAWAGEAAMHPQMAAAVALLGGAAVVAAGHEVMASAVTLGGRSAWDAAVPLSLGYAVNLAISLAGASRFGILAVAGGTLIGNIVTGALVWKRGRALLGWDPSAVGRLLTPVAIAGLCACTVGLALGALPVDSALGSIVSCTVAMAAGLAALALVRRKLA
ncbi:MAG: oligosaccharide flippase family protein [Polyangiaceae bacterium]|nr:oligosaccharide flippase family protein [Polyangiaceae bacterium]